MSAKKSAKTLLEYDPLSWLKEDNSEKPAAAKKKSVRKKTASKKSASAKKAKASKANTKKAAPPKKQAAAAKKTSVNKVAGANIETKQSLKSTDMVEETGFGFFTDQATTSSESVTMTPANGEFLKLGCELTIRNVAEFKQQVEASLASEIEIKLDPSELQKIDASGLQMLYSLQKTLAKSSQQLCWSSRSPILDSAATLIGMGELTNATKALSGQDQGFGFF